MAATVPFSVFVTMGTEVHEQMFWSVDINNNHPKKLPETISFYNSTKFDVDIADQMARKYSVKAGSRRWPVHVFYNILDLTGINPWILYKEVTGKKLMRRKYLHQLNEELRSACIHIRKYKPDTQTKADTTEESVERQKRVHCQAFKCRNETVDTCSDCKIPICGKCTKYIKSCPKCA
ncbi:DDE_Tnp_1_7 domain-containing protein [Trichonephila clavipes]|nr:DDE_Tnp_1_7 domain-containing protein [Trichonephila clavipes]